jgi:hypothetical protein
MDKKTQSLVLWGLGGIPIAVGLFQAIGAIIQYPVYKWLVIGVVSKVLNSFIVFRIAGSRFADSDPLVFLLIFAITAIWIAFGATLAFTLPLSREQREFIRTGSIYGGIGYSIVFAYVFIDILFGSYPLIQRVTVAALPLFAVAPLLGAKKIAPSVDSKTLVRLEEQIKEKQRQFTNQFNAVMEPALGDLEELRRDSGTIENYRDKQRIVMEDLEEWKEEIDDLKQSDFGDQDTIQQTKQLEVSITNFEPEEQFEKIAEELRVDLRNLFDERYLDFWNELVSPYSRVYGERIVNIEEYTTIYLPPKVANAVDMDGDTDGVFIKEMSELRQNMISRSVPVNVSTSGLLKLEDHIYGENGLKNKIETRENSFTAKDTELKDQLEYIESTIQNTSSPLDDYLSDRYLEGHSSKTDVNDIRKFRQNALDSLHQCTFEPALEELDKAIEKASNLRQALKFIELTVTTAKDGGDYINIHSIAHDPTDVFTTEMLKSSEFQEKFEQATGHTVQMNGEENQLVFAGGSITTDNSKFESVSVDDPSNAPSESDLSKSTDSGGSQEPSETEVFLGAKYNLSRLKEGVKNGADHIEVGEDRTVRMQVSPIEEMYQKEGVYEDLRKFLNQSDLVSDVTIDVDDTEGYIEFKHNDNKGIHRTVKQLQSQYEENNNE